MVVTLDKAAVMVVAVAVVVVVVLYQVQPVVMTGDSFDVDTL